MEDLVLLIPATETTPRIELNPIKNKYIIEGGSLPFNANSFYSPVIAWLNKHGEKHMANVIFEMKLTYFNTPTTMKLSHILTLLEGINLKGNEIKVRWTYLEEDDKEEIMEAFYPEIKIPFEFEQISKWEDTSLHNKNKSVSKLYAGAYDQQLIEKCTKLLNYVVGNSLMEKTEETFSINTMYNFFNQEIPRDEIEFILDTFHKSNTSFLTKYTSAEGEHGYLLNTKKEAYQALSN